MTATEALSGCKLPRSTVRSGFSEPWTRIGPWTVAIYNQTEPPLQSSLWVILSITRYDVLIRTVPRLATDGKPQLSTLRRPGEAVEAWLTLGETADDVPSVRTALQDVIPDLTGAAFQMTESWQE
eukprot:gb/GEZN01008798.1/.p1 GENE.gb/GEZN01008798.1/~~gb/GEZN01008798.1/.p1  ORF type:complete len:125 (-),score=5.61 gb/GEZN01008798.1/:642-1016(-)